MGCAHMGLPQVAALPIFVEHEMRRVVVVLMQVVVEAAFLGARDVNQLLKLGLHEVDLVRVSLNVGDDGQFRHLCVTLDASIV